MNQKGFGALESILMLVIVGIIGATGWYVYAANKKTNDTFNSASKVASASAPQHQKASRPAANAKYLEIKELGIKFKLNDQISDAYYYVNSQGLVYLSVHRLDNLKGFEGCTANGGDGEGNGLAAVDSAKVGDDNFGTPFTQQDLESRGGVKVGETYYWIEPNSQAPCYDMDTVSENNPTVQSLPSWKNALVGQQKTITKI